ncbi:hypothetical protein COOONC_06163 [Cooperia oncophora]
MNSQLVAVAIVAFLAIRPSAAQTPKAKFDSKVKALGVKFYTVAEIGKLTDCIDDSFYACATMKEIKEKAISCAMENTAAAKYITLMKLLTGMDNCLKPEGQTTMKLIDKVTPSAFTVVQGVYNKTIADIKIAKNAGKSKAEVMDIGYTTIAGQIITKLEWNCYLTKTTDLLDMTLYECSKIVKK